MSGPVTMTHMDQSIEEQGMRRQGMLGRGAGMGNALYAILREQFWRSPQWAIS